MWVLPDDKSDTSPLAPSASAETYQADNEQAHVLLEQRN